MRMVHLALGLCLAPGCVFDTGGSDTGGGGQGPRFPGGVGDPLPGAETTCYYGEDDPDRPAATIEHVLEVVEGVDALHVRFTLDPRFVDNTYGANAIGWPDGKKTHKFDQLVGSDHALMRLETGAGATVAEFEIDYISADSSAVSGYATLGVTGGDGSMRIGDVSAVLRTSTSLHRNLNERGYAQYIVDSPATDEQYTPNPATPDWDYRVVYEAWVDVAVFSGDVGTATVDFIHASPSKTGENTVVVDPRPCPPDWDDYCNNPDGCDGGGSGDPPQSCQTDSDCATGELCDNNTCQPYVQ